MPGIKSQLLLLINCVALGKLNNLSLLKGLTFPIHKMETIMACTTEGCSENKIILEEA